MIEAPVAAAEFADRTAPPASTKELLALINLRLVDPVFFDAALPAAIGFVLEEASLVNRSTLAKPSTASPVVRPRPSSHAAASIRPRSMPYCCAGSRWHRAIPTGSLPTRYSKRHVFGKPPRAALATWTAISCILTWWRRWTARRQSACHPTGSPSCISLRLGRLREMVCPSGDLRHRFRENRMLHDPNTRRSAARPGEGRLSGVRAIIIYPLNALIESQRERLAAWTE